MRWHATSCTNRLICLSSQALCEDVELGGVCDYASPLEILEPRRFWLQTATTSGQKRPCFFGVMEWIGCRVWGAWGGGFQVRQVPKAMQVGRDLLCLSVWVWKQTGATMIREPYPRIVLSPFSRTWLNMTPFVVKSGAIFPGALGKSAGGQFDHGGARRNV